MPLKEREAKCLNVNKVEAHQWLGFYLEPSQIRPQEGTSNPMCLIAAMYTLQL